MIDPHTAVAVAAVRKMKNLAAPIVILSTAHPAKFGDAVTRAIGTAPTLPAPLAAVMNAPQNLDVRTAASALIKGCSSSRLRP